MAGSDYHYNGSKSRPNQRSLIFYLNTEVYTLVTFFLGSFTCLCLIYSSVANVEFYKILKMCNEVRRCYLASDFLAFKTFDDLRDVIDIMMWRVRIFLESMQLLMILL